MVDDVTPTQPAQSPNGVQSLTASGAPPATRYIVPPPAPTVAINVPSDGTAFMWLRFATVAALTPTQPGQSLNGLQSLIASGAPPAMRYMVPPPAPTVPTNVPFDGTAFMWLRFATVDWFTATQPAQSPNGVQSLRLSGAPPAMR